MKRRLFAAVLISAALCGAPSTAHASSMTVVDLGPANVVGNTASIDVSFIFTSTDPADTLEAFQLSVLGSDPLLTANGTNFNRFSFARDAGTLPGWNEVFGPIAALGFTVHDNLPAGTPLSPNALPQHIGVLSVNLGGLPPSFPVFVTLAGNDPVFPTDVAGLVDGVFTSYHADPSDNAVLAFGQPNGVSFLTPVPEPASVVLFGAGMLGMLAWCRGRRSRLFDQRSVQEGLNEALSTQPWDG